MLKYVWKLWIYSYFCKSYMMKRYLNCTRVVEKLHWNIISKIKILGNCGVVRLNKGEISPLSMVRHICVLSIMREYLVPIDQVLHQVIKY